VMQGHGVKDEGGRMKANSRSMRNHRNMGPEQAFSGLYAAPIDGFARYYESCSAGRAA